MIRRPPRSTQGVSSAASDVYKRQLHIKAMYFLPFWLIFQNLLPFFIGGFGVAGGGVAYLAHIGGFVLGLAVGYAYRKSRGSQFTYGTRYGYRGDYK